MQIKNILKTLHGHSIYLETKTNESLNMWYVINVDIQLIYFNL
jgi:hypothetical protein